MIKYTEIHPESITEKNLIEVTSESLNSFVSGVSDDFFSPVKDLIKPEPAASKKGQFGPNGALYDGWETRRHNPTYDWAIIQLGAPSAKIKIIDIDTTHFNGNEAPYASVYATFAPNEDVKQNDSRWFELLPVVPLGPSQQHAFEFEWTEPITHLQLRMIPDGGIARFRAYGEPTAVWPSDLTSTCDLASVFVGGRVIFTSDQHFGKGANLILPGRGHNMGDGWETKRSRQAGHKDYVIVQLGAAGYIQHAEIDTCHFKGNFPASVAVEGIYAPEGPPTEYDTQGWTQLLSSQVSVGPHAQHYFQTSQAELLVTHVRITIFPDGGLKRVRLVGSRALPASVDIKSGTPNGTKYAGVDMPTKALPVLPLTSSAFVEYGHVVQSYQDKSSTPPSIQTKRVNNGTATKFCNLSPLINDYPECSPANMNFCVYKCDPVDTSDGFTIEMLERHRYTTQSFIPMGDGGSRYVVIVAQNGSDDKPKMETLRAFTATSNQGITYKPGVWHHPMIALEKATDFGCLVYESGERIDCEEAKLEDLQYKVIL